MKIETQQDWNTVLDGCGCCPMPLCPVPQVECESASVTITADHESEWNQFQEAYQAWVDGGEVGDPPEWPENTSHGLWAPWARPEGDDEDDVPTLYRTVALSETQDGQSWYDGIIGQKDSGNDWYFDGANSDYYERFSWTSHAVRTYSNEVYLGGSEAASAYESEKSATHPHEETSCASTAAPTAPYANDFGEWTLTDDGFFSCTETVNTYHGPQYEKITGTDPGAEDCTTSPWGQAQGGAFLHWEWANLTRSDPGTAQTLGDSVNYAFLHSEAETELESAEWDGVECVSAHTKNWPLIGAYDWGISCETLYSNLDSRNATGSSVLLKSRFKWVIPDTWTGSWFKITWDLVFFPPGYAAWLEIFNTRAAWEAAVAAYAAWEIAHAAWATEHAAWETAYAAWETAHAAWQQDIDDWMAANDAYQAWLDGGEVGDPPPAPGPYPSAPEPIAPAEPPEPVAPPEPGPEPPAAPAQDEDTTPVAVSKDQTWEWDGPGNPEDPESWKSGFYEIPVPENPGETRRVNVRFQCYKSTKFGVKPQVTGEAYEYPPEPPP